MRGMAELLKNDSRAAVEAVGHALGAWTPSARVRGYQEASCAHCGHKVVTGPRGMVGQLPPCRRGARRPDTRTVADPAVRAIVAGHLAKSLLQVAELLAKGRNAREWRAKGADPGGLPQVPKSR